MITYMMRSLTLMIGFLVIGGLLYPSFVVYAGSEVYVDEDADSGGDGSKDEPYKKIGKALSKGGKTIRIAKGTYDEDITVGKGVSLKGKGRDKVEISGKVTMKDGSKLEDLTVSGGGVVVDDGADAKLSDVTVKNAGTGIITEGRGELKLRDVKVHSNGKGMYIQQGKDVEIIGSEIRDNGEEGVDIRANVDGVISGNVISGNRESGIEVILGSSELEISNNNIKNNRASGIAAQYYKSAKKLGGLKITGNKINGSKDYGLTCKAPSGGNPGESYWSDSIVLVGNTMSGNKLGTFAPGCFFAQEKEADAVMTEEEKLLAKEAKKDPEAEPLEAQVSAEQQEVVPVRYSYVQTREKKKVLEEQRQDTLTAENVAEIAQATEDAQSSTQQAAQKLAAEKRIKIYYVGRDSQALATLDREVAAMDERIEMLREIEASLDPSNINFETVSQMRATLEGLQEQDRSRLETYQKGPGVTTFFKSFFTFN